ncbi:WD domain, G-beta repeat protein [Streptomyces viridochromogenes]|uniref:WD domain, G-beta repeat protein n=1 Tax=Streptomyces viridochromogenes TaxID=1938 RepID=A0A0J8BTN7_STRVR|nr:WD domain, G-beta repeat protein [Streptomyces viridochromogenes]KMS68930.1 WD domain, G-beta repeat protein [Streptomyces viridochromogenes]
MGRPERPLDPAAGPIARLAHELREVRKAAGTPSYRRMAEVAGFSATTLSQAAGGERLPSLAVVQGYVRACGGDPGEWEARWKDAEAEVSGAAREDDEDAAPPYRGLARFEPADQGLFFGRDRLVEELLELVCGHRFAAVFGASGSGKSSLLRAGLIPRLQKEIADRGGPAVLRVLTPGQRPAATYGHLLTPAEDEPESWVVVDQFEEVFTLCRDRAERARFVDLLLAARDPGSRLRVLIAVRADFYPRCGEHRDLADALCGAGLLVGPMTADELREAVVKPAQQAGLLVERELTARIVEEVLDEPGGLPMLSHALLETWRRRKGRLLTLAAYEAAGGVHGAIAASAEEAYGQLTAPQAEAARRLLLRMVEPGQGTPDTRRPLTRAEQEDWACPDVPAVVERLARARLLTVDEEDAQLAHEALINSWPRLHDWIEEERERLRHHRRLTEAARAWLEHDRDPGGLYRGSRLARAEELFGADDGTLTVSERAFLVAALEAREAERRAAARTARRSRVLVTALSAVLAVALVVSLAAWSQHLDNERQRTDTTARRVASVADSLRTTDPRAAMLLGAAAWRVSPLAESRRALLGALAQPERDTFSDPAPGDTALRFLTTSGRVLLSVAGRTWRTYDVAAHRRTGSGRLPADAAEVVGLSPDAKVIALSGQDGIRLWDTVAGRWTGGGPWQAFSAVVGDRAFLVTGSDDERAVVRSRTDGKSLFESPQVVDRADMAPDAGTVAVCPAGGQGATPQVWDVTRQRKLSGEWAQDKDVCADNDATLVMGGGQRMAAVSPAGVRVWNTGSGKQLADLSVPDVGYAAFSGDGKFLAAVDSAEIKVWRLSSPDAPVFRHSFNNQYVYGALAWDPTHPVLRYLESGTVHSLDVSAAVTPDWQDDGLSGVRLAPDGRTLATAKRTSTGTGYSFQLRDTGAGQAPRTLPSPPMPVALAGMDPVVPGDTLALTAFSPDGAVFAYGVSAPGREAAPQRITIWDVRHSRVRETLDLATPDSTGPLIDIALGAGGRTLYAVRTPTIDDLADEVWDTASHRRTSVVTGLNSSRLAVRPDDGLLVGDNRVARLPKGPVAGKGLVQGDQIGSIAFSGDGSRLAVGDGTGRVALWDGNLKHKAGVLRNVFPARLGDTPEGVSALALSPDGRTLAVGGSSGTLQLWDVPTQQPLGGPLPTAGEEIVSVAFSADSSTVYATGLHVPLQRYVVDPERVVERVCARVGGQLTPAQWRTYVPDAPYRKVCGD